MNRFEVQEKEVDNDSLLGTYASIDDVSTVISEDVVIEKDGVPILIYYADSGIDVEPMRTAFEKIDWSDSYRATAKHAMRTTSKCFGYQPRSGMRNRPCAISALAMEEPELHSTLERWTELVCELYWELAPEAAKIHKDKCNEKIKEQWHLRSTMFTSGIINKTNQLPYHFDRGNFVGAWSAMIGMKKWIEGGYLIIPRYDIAIEIADSSLSLFDGQENIHGVTPIKKQNPLGERYTIVWYSLENMWQCLTTKEELDLINEKATKQALKKKTDGNVVER